MSRSLLVGYIIKTFLIMGKFINPFTDVGFKKLFGQEVNKELLIEFLNDLLVGERQVKDISFMDKEIVPESLGGRVVIFDILCKDSAGVCFIVELQNQYQDYFFDRGLYYLCRMMNAQGKRGPNWNYEICPVYGIYFLNFRLPNLSKFRTDIVLTDRESGVVMNEKLRQIYLSLPYFLLEEDECNTDFECWIYLLKHMDTLERMPFEAKKAVFRKLLEVADVENMTPEERLCYDESVKAYRDYYNTIASAERISRERGLAEGRAEGRAKGLAEGLAEGDAKNKERLLLVASNMKKKGIDLASIVECTGLDEEIVNAL